MSKRALPEVSAEELQRRFGNNLRRVRLSLGLTQKEAAEAAQANQTYLSQVELGNKNMTLESMAQLANGLGVSVAALLMDDDDIITLADLSRVISIAHEEVQALIPKNSEAPVTASMLGQLLHLIFSRLITTPRTKP
jgi:XRE family transcriptional regulator, regulator of sulfur utilization